MKIFKAIKGSQVSYHNSMKKALKSKPQAIFQERDLIVPRS